MCETMSWRGARECPGGGGRERRCGGAGGGRGGVGWGGVYFKARILPRTIQTKQGGPMSPHASLGEQNRLGRCKQDIKFMGQ
jgi:hypothetical protein